jgi:hypothetical protein
MALAAVAVMAPAASASWLDEGTAFSGERTISVEGFAGWETVVGGVECESATFNFVIVGGSSTGRAEGLIASHECHSSGALAGCQVVESDLTGEPVLLQNATDTTVTNVTLWTEYEQTPGGPECGVEEC